MRHRIYKGPLMFPGGGEPIEQAIEGDRDGLQFRRLVVKAKATLREGIGCDRIHALLQLLQRLQTTVNHPPQQSTGKKGSHTGTGDEEQKQRALLGQLIAGVLHGE